MKTMTTILAPLLTVSLAGCALFVPTDAYAPVRLEREAAPAANARQGEEAGSVVQGPLTLPKCVEIALANNPGLAAGRRGVDVAQAERDAAAAEWWPSVRAVGSYEHHLDNQRLLPADRPRQWGAFSDDFLEADLVVRMPLYTGGRITYAIQGAELLRQAAEHRLARTREELVFNVASIFYGILGQRRVIDSLEFSHKALEEHRRRVEDLLDVQKAARVDLLRTEVRLADIKQKLVRERNVLAIQQRVLANLLGVRLASGGPAVQGRLEMAAAEADLSQYLARAYAARADYLAARAALEAQAKRVDVARAGYTPTVSAVGLYGRRWTAHSIVPQTGGEQTGDLGHVGVEVDVPIFEGGRIAARVRKERAALAQAQETLRKLQLQVRLDVETAVLNVTSTRDRGRATEKAIEQAEESLRIEREKYGLGKGSITDVLDAQSALLDAQTAHYEALAEYNTSIAQLRLAVGEEP